jgi:hypothetical protein
MCISGKFKGLFRQFNPLIGVIVRLFDFSLEGSYFAFNSLYGEDNPVTYTDPSGQAVLVAGGAAAGSFLGPVGTVCGIIVGSALTIIIGGTIIDNIISNLNLSSSGANKGTSKPVDAPSGTKPIDQVGLPRDLIHEIKGDIGARPNDWTGVTPDGDVITAGPDGKTVNHGPVEAWQ